MKIKSVLKALAALSQENRLRAFRTLVVAGTAGTTPTAIAGQLKVSQATLSFHLKELMNAGLVTRERIGRHIVYRADFRRMDNLLSFLMENCCQGQACRTPNRPELAEERT
jgi:DNA-binding transcriptional ArsR family regulator